MQPLSRSDSTCRQKTRWYHDGRLTIRTSKRLSTTVPMTLKPRPCPRLRFFMLRYSESTLFLCCSSPSKPRSLSWSSKSSHELETFAGASATMNGTSNRTTVAQHSKGFSVATALGTVQRAHVQQPITVIAIAGPHADSWRIVLISIATIRTIHSTRRARFF